MRSESFSVNDLLRMEAFREWVKKPTPKLDSFWKTWRGNDPKRAELMDQASRIVLSIDFKKTDPQDIDDQRIFNKIKRTIQKDRDQPDPDFPER